MKPLPVLAAALLLACWIQARADEIPPSPADAIQAFRTAKLPEFTKLVEETLRHELTQAKIDEPGIIRLTALRAFALRMADLRPGSSAESETLEWLVNHPTLGPLLLTAISERDNPARVLSVLAALRTAFGKTIEQFPELTVAICVVWDSTAIGGQTPEQATLAACDIFAHLTQNRRVLRYDPQVLPWQVLLYLVDSRVTPDERRWAINSYRLPQIPGQAYFEIHYDMSAYHSGKWRGGEKFPYTLWNIQKLGGVCKDQAHFTVEVCRAYGIPATVCTGQSGSGEGFHAWVGLLAIVQKTAVFDFQTARYKEAGFWSGTVIDPQTGQQLTDGEAALVAEWCQVKPNRRLLSLALSESLDLVDPTQRIDFCKKSIESSPGNQQAWTALVNECLRPEAPPSIVQEVASVVERFAVGRYDNFAFKIFTTLLNSRKPEEQLAILDRMNKVFPGRPDLLAEIVMIKGDVLRKNAKPVDALKLYIQLLTKSHFYGPLMLDAMDRVDEMLRGAGKMRELLDQYRLVWKQMASPEPSGYAWTTPWFIMGERYAKLLDEAGDKATAANVRLILRAHDQSHWEDSK
jgi:hypothetical protein